MTTAVEEPITQTGEGDTPPPVEPAIEDRPIHLARCAECAHAVKYRASASGAGFTLVEGTDVTYGVGADGRPICPNGHGEMTIADDQCKPAAEAITEAAQRVAAENGRPVQGSLPGVLPPFNYEGALRDLVTQAEEVERLRKIHEDDAAKAKKSKQAWEGAEELLTKMGLTYSARVRQRDAGFRDTPTEPEAPPRLVTCAWVEQHPGETCWLCSAVPAEVERMLGNPSVLAPRDAQAHVEEADRFAVAIDADTTQEALEAIDIYVSPDVLRGWTSEERKAAQVWADYQDDLANGIAQTDPDAAETPQRPAILGRPHIPQKPVAGERQVCSICEVVLVAASLEDEKYDETDLVGVDCSGKAPAEPVRYPERSKKKPAAKKGRKK
jgi:hypothetical protein